MKKHIFLLLLIAIFASTSVGQAKIKISKDAKKATQDITAKQLSDYLHYIASDEMEGRDTPSRGLDSAAKFMATMLSRWGVKPAGDAGSYFQRMWVVRKLTDSTGSMAEINGQKLTYGEDFFADPNTATANAPLVFGGNGWLHKAKGVDAFAGIDVKGKIVVIYADGLPKGITFQDLQGKRGEDWADPTTYAKAKGAVGIISVATNTQQTNWERVKTQRERGGLNIENLREPDKTPQIPVIVISQKTANKLFEGESGNPLTNPDLKAFDFTNKNASVKTAFKPDRVPTQNVVGMIEGSDPVLKNETIVISAHYDHEGVRPNTVGDDKIWNGADDDGSGTTAIFGIAEALGKSPRKPKRSIILLWVAGEEKGLLGSEYFVKFPTVPLDKIVANINIDMIGRSRKPDNTAATDKDLSGENEIYVIGSNMMSTKLGEVTHGVNKSYLNLGYNLKYDDPKDTNRFFFRSDHFNFAVNGIPAVFFFNGTHVDYHGKDDEPEKIDYVRMEKITRTILLTAWTLADLKERPKVDKELPKELTQR
jgi:Peptidase family M28/PA domain